MCDPDEEGGDDVRTDEVLIREWSAASADELRRQLQGTHELLLKARRVIARQRQQLEVQQHALEVEPKKVKLLTRDKATLKRWVEDGEAALEELRKAGFLGPPRSEEAVGRLTKRLCCLLQAHGMTAAALSRVLEVDSIVASETINGTRQLTPDLIGKLAAHFDLPDEYFL